MERLVGLLANELNVKEVSFLSSADALVTLEAKPNFRSLGKKFGKQTPLAAQAVTALTSEALLAFEKGEPLAISVGNDAKQLDADDLTIVRRASGKLVVKEAGGYFAAIDATVTPELRTEGLAREIVSRVQRMRKEAGFAVSDRISFMGCRACGNRSGCSAPQGLDRRGSSGAAGERGWKHGNT